MRRALKRDADSLFRAAGFSRKTNRYTKVAGGFWHEMEVFRARVVFRGGSEWYLDALVSWEDRELIRGMDVSRFGERWTGILDSRRFWRHEDGSDGQVWPGPTTDDEVGPVAEVLARQVASRILPYFEQWTSGSVVRERFREVSPRDVPTSDLLRCLSVELTAGRTDRAAVLLERAQDELERDQPVQAQQMWRRAREV